MAAVDSAVHSIAVFTAPAGSPKTASRHGREEGGQREDGTTRPSDDEAWLLALRRSGAVV
ncbi:MAG TPA: hypothetical protein VFY14_16470 [Streptomyces sp.]|nr:hypothetical protein [Streptomyces sp.]